MPLQMQQLVNYVAIILLSPGRNDERIMVIEKKRSLKDRHDGRVHCYDKDISHIVLL